jgi:hypothetical protein
MVLIQDGMALLQSMNVKAFKTFGDLAEHFIKCQQQCFTSAATVSRACLLAFTPRNFFQSGIGRPSIN